MGFAGGVQVRDWWCRELFWAYRPKLNDTNIYEPGPALQTPQLRRVSNLRAFHDLSFQIKTKWWITLHPKASLPQPTSPPLPNRTYMHLHHDNKHVSKSSFQERRQDERGEEKWIWNHVQNSCYSFHLQIWTNYVHVESNGCK